MTTAVEIRNVVKNYGSVCALRNVSMHIGDSEFFTLLGPSGCGKTTLLRIIAGFEDLNDGGIFLHGKALQDAPPHKRPINTVFQEYALFPHMTVLDNVMFGLRMQKKPAAEAKRRAEQMLELTRLGEFAGRLPAQLSGGQQQRVALARALAPQPEVLLLDESLSALDLKLRQAMRLELKQIQREIGITFVFVTHDQDEALTMSDRIAVMSNGEVQQIGTPSEIYNAPVNCFVADFIGETNLLRGETRRLPGNGAEFVLPGGFAIPLPATEDVRVVSVRPEKIKYADDTPTLRGTVVSSVYAGATTQTTVRLGDDGPALLVRETGDNMRAVGDTVGLSIDAGAVHPLHDE